MPARKIIPLRTGSRSGSGSGTVSGPASGSVPGANAASVRAEISGSDGRAKDSARVIRMPDGLTRYAQTHHTHSVLAVSVVVPTCGRVELLNRCLEALCSQNLQSPYEIIVVDDRPNVETRRLVESWAAKMTDGNLDLIYRANAGPHGPAAARNRGWRIARAAIIAFTDDDTVPAPTWLKSGLAAFDNSVHALSGRIEMPLSAQPTDYERDAKNLETAEFVTANCFCRKEVLDFMNGFDERFRYAWREDSDFHFRLLSLQANIVSVPQAVVVHPVRPERWGVSMAQQKKILFDALLYKKHPLMYRKKIRATPRWDYYLIVLALLASLLSLAWGSRPFAAASAGVWAVMTARFIMMRLQGTQKTFSHIAEMVITSVFIPPQAVFWRLVGAVRFRVLFL